MVCDPLSVRDCCLVTDGGAAVVMTRADRARDLAARPAYLLAGAAATTHNRTAAMPDLTVTGAADTGPRDRKRLVSGKSGSVRVDLWCRSLIKKEKTNRTT